MNQNPYLPGNPEEFIEKNMKLAQMVAWKFVNEVHKNPTGFDMDDFLGIAYLGLVKAYQGFDPTGFTGENGGQIQFSTYAVPKIHGEIRRHLRDYNSMIRPYRLEKEMLRKAETTALTKDEAERVEKSLASKCIDSLNRPIEIRDNEKLCVGDTLIIDHDNDFEKMVVKDFVNTLSKLQKVIYVLRAQYGLSQSEIGKVLHVSQVSVSRYEGSLMDAAREYGKEHIA